MEHISMHAASKNVNNYNYIYIYIYIYIYTRSELASLARSFNFNTCMKTRIVTDQHVAIIICYSLHVHTKLSH